MDNEQRSERGKVVDKHLELRVKSDTNVQQLATSIFKSHEEGKRLVLSCIGVQASNQALKSVGAANQQAVLHGYTLALIPYFEVRHFDDPSKPGATVERTAILMRVIQVPVGGW